MSPGCVIQEAEDTSVGVNGSAISDPRPENPKSKYKQNRTKKEAVSNGRGIPAMQEAEDTSVGVLSS